MFDFFKRKTPIEYAKAAEDIYKMVQPVERQKEHYRVGFTDDGDTTLTLIGDGGNTMTLTMSQDACEQMIRMLRSTYDQSVGEDA
jgi:hypothetical protein